jgi:hypothetical protein
MKQGFSKINQGRLAGLMIFVFLFSLASHSQINSAFANENTSHEKVQTSGFGNFYKTNAKLPKDDSMAAKIKEAKEKLQEEMKQQKETEKSKVKGYSEKNTDVANTAKTKVTVKSSEDKPETDVKAPIDKKQKD